MPLARERELARGFGVALVLVGLGVTVYFYRTLPEDPFVFVLPYVLPSALLCVGGIPALCGLRG